MQAVIAVHYGNDYAFALALVAGIVAVLVVIPAAPGVEAKGVAFDTERPPGMGAAASPAT